jgi:uncharacterized membrane protein YhaH (DUF805 family)
VLAVKRLHDINWSGWWAAPLMVSSFIGSSFSPYLHHGTPEEAVGAWFGMVLFSLVPIVTLGLIKGTPEANMHGGPPP